MRYPIRVVGDAGLVQNRVVSTGPCKLAALTGFSDGTATYVQVFGTSTPSAFDTPIFSFPVAANSAWALALPNPIDLDGCKVVQSSAVDNWTDVAGAHISVQALLAA